MKMEEGATSKGNGFSPQPPEGMQPCRHLDLSPGRLISDYDVQNCEILNVVVLYLFIYLATARGLWDLTSPTRDRTPALGSESMES